MVALRDYAEVFPDSSHHVVGTVKVLPDVTSPQLDNTRDLLVYLPPSYEASDARYPVIYMHDGQNLFDPATSYAGEWQVDETMEMLAAEGLEAIVVGVPNVGRSRLDEYSPFVDRRLGGGQGHRYLDFLVETVKPLIDANFRTDPEPASTAIVGASMGGLISLCGFFRHPEVFGLAGVMSPSLWFADRAIFDYVRQAPTNPGRLYLDTGTHESPPTRGLLAGLRATLRSRRYMSDTQHLYGLLLSKGYRARQTVLYLEEPGGTHSEAAWARRFPEALRFLFGLPPRDPRAGHRKRLPR